MNKTEQKPTDLASRLAHWRQNSRLGRLLRELFPYFALIGVLVVLFQIAAFSNMIRTDIALLRSEMVLLRSEMAHNYATLDAKIESKAENLHTKIESSASALNSRIDNVEIKVEAGFEILNLRLDGLEKDYAQFGLRLQSLEDNAAQR